MKEAPFHTPLTPHQSTQGHAQPLGSDDLEWASLPPCMDERVRVDERVDERADERVDEHVDEHVGGGGAGGGGVDGGKSGPS